jgi:hypothetical protein
MKVVVDNFNNRFNDLSFFFVDRDDLSYFNFIIKDCIYFLKFKTYIQIR